MRASPDDPNALAIAAPRSGLHRLWIFAAAAAIEIAVAAALFRFAARPLDLPYWRDPIFLANALAKIALVAFALFLVALWPRRHELLDTYRRSAAHDPYTRYLLLNAALFATLLAARYALSLGAEQPLPVLAAYAVLPLLTGVSLALIAAPLSFWRRLLTLAPAELVVALTLACAATWLAGVARSSWYSLSDATLAVSSWILHLYEPGALVDFDKRVLAVNDFSVEVWGPCSGYEGIVLILTVLPLYLWAFRRELRFPNVLLLVPLGMAAVWFLNAARIALLVSIGAHVSPEIAVQGFHSQAGWVGFLAVTLGVIAVSRQVPFFATPPSRRAAAEPLAARPSAQASDPTLDYLAPFMAMLAANILASAFVPHDQWLYALKVAGIGAALWWFRGVYLPLLVHVSWSSVAIGLAVGVLWIATDPGRGLPTDLGLWLSGLPLWAGSLWLLMRGVGTIALVPFAEELAFRGFLARALVSMRFERVGFGEFRPLAFVLSSAAFGLMHERWLAGLLAGAVYALLMYRTGRLSDPIAAHAASNAVIFAWAVAAQQWSLL